MTTTISTVVAPRDERPPTISVVLGVTGTFERIDTTMRHLRAQTIRDRMELLIVAPADVRFRIPPGAAEGLHCCRLIELASWSTLSGAKGEAIHAATAPLVAFAEDHSFPEPGWAEALVAAGERGCAGVGVQMYNANPWGMLSWAAMFIHFGGAVEPEGTGETSYTSASHNTAYDREALLSLGGALPRLMQAEVFLQEALRARGYRMYREPAARTRHVNTTRLRPWLLHHFVGGRLYGGLRAELGGWSLGRRLVYAAGSPIVPPLRTRRVVREIRRTSHGSFLLPRVLPAVVLGLCANALGECAGYVLGVGGTEARYSEMELRKWDAVRPADRRAWA